jgi:hypothetical protein
MNWARASRQAAVSSSLAALVQVIQAEKHLAEICLVLLPGFGHVLLGNRRVIRGKEPPDD